MKYTYKTQGTCSRSISFDLSDDNIINDLSFEGGCNGNLKGISALAQGKKAEDVIATLEGITCSFKSTSCPDQLAKALKKALSSKE